MLSPPLGRRTEPEALKFSAIIITIVVDIILIIVIIIRDAWDGDGDASRELQGLRGSRLPILFGRL